MSTSRTYVAGAVLTAAQQNDLAQGLLGYASSTSTQTGVGAEVDVTGCSVAVTVVAGRRIRITARVNTATASVADVGVFILIKESTTELGRIGVVHSIGAREITAHGSTIITPSAGAHTYKLTIQAVGGTIATASLTSSPNFILVEDIGV